MSTSEQLNAMLEEMGIIITIYDYGMREPKIVIDTFRHDKQVRAEVISEISREMRVLYGNEYEKKIRADVISEIKDASVIFDGEKIYGSKTKVILITEEKYNEIFNRKEQK